MIKANELRIRNWIMVAGTGELHPVQVNIDNLRQLIIAPEYAAAIPLTPEILERCGFEKEEPLGWYRKGFMDIFEGNPFHYASGNSLCPDLLYLHQLQNLYFALTGEELEIKELEHA